MQYILSEEEYEKLINEAKEQKIIAKKKLQDLCTKVADHMPVYFWDRDEPAPWMCIHSIEDWYCDECPVQEVCPSTKQYSK